MTVKIIKRRFLLQFRDLLPSTSPIDNNYKPTKFKCFNKTYSLLQQYHHRWRCTGPVQYQNFRFTSRWPTKTPSFWPCTYWVNTSGSASYRPQRSCVIMWRSCTKILNDRTVFLQRLSPNRKKLLHDKLECATLFSSKASYQSTIPHIYRNDYLGMHAEAKWLDIRNKNQFSPSQVFIIDSDWPGSRVKPDWSIGKPIKVILYFVTLFKKSIELIANHKI